MLLDDILKVGEVCEVSGKTIKVGVCSEKNVEYINYNGQAVKNVGIGNFILIRKGFDNIIGKIEGEQISEISKISTYSNMNEKIERILSISVLGALVKDKFVHGLTALPLVGNFAYIVTENIVRQIFAKTDKDTLTLGSLIGYANYPFTVSVQDLLCSHIGIFGNTGSGKSNTLAKLYYETINQYSTNNSFQKNSKFIFIDFNGEYGSVFPNAKVYNLSTRSNKGDKYPISNEDMQDKEFWSIILEATDKTQTPFIGRVLRKYNKMIENNRCITTNEICKLLFNSQPKYLEVRPYLQDLFSLLGIDPQLQTFTQSFLINAQSGQFRTTYNDYNVTPDIIHNTIFPQRDTPYIEVDLSNSFVAFEIALIYKIIDEISRNYIIKEHIGPLMARAKTKLNLLDKVLEIQDNIDDNQIEVISLSSLNTEMKKTIPLMICKKLYDKKKKAKRKTVETTLHIIVDEAHNILSNVSNRESEQWKEYRLECFEEIIKEGRKFGVFLTVSSQRPSDISDTIISQLHNYFIHRLVNEEDLRKIQRTLSFSDKATNEMISILTAGGCIFSGLATNFPILAQISILNRENQPHSETVSILEAWKDIK